jgi:hypothetical protein
MRRISLRERQILHLRFAEDLTQAEIGEPIGLSQMQISRIIPQALARLEVSAEQSVAGVSSAPRRSAGRQPHSRPPPGVSSHVESLRP